MVEDQPSEFVEWIYPMVRELDNWTAEVLPNLIDNMTLMSDDASKSNRPNEGENLEEEALVVLEGLLEQERPRLQSRVEELEVINLVEGDEAKKSR
ncbi:hypothetical protein CR513_57163, partial [Mucuna pruriens]